MRTLLRETLFFIVIVLLFAGAAKAASWYVGSRGTPAAAADVQYKTQEETDNIYVRFDMEAYDQIVANYWQQVKDSDLSQLHQLSLQKALTVGGLPPAAASLPTQDRAGTAKMLYSAFQAATSTDIQKQLAVNTLMVVLYNLAPVGRDQLLSQGQETQLRQEVSNVNPA